MNKKVLVYSTGNFIQYPVINHDRTEYEKEYATEYFAVLQKLTPHCKSTILENNKLKKKNHKTLFTESNIIRINKWIGIIVKYI